MLYHAFSSTRSMLAGLSLDMEPLEFWDHLPRLPSGSVSSYTGGGLAGLPSDLDDLLTMCCSPMPECTLPGDEEQEQDQDDENSSSEEEEEDVSSPPPPPPARVVVAATKAAPTNYASSPSSSSSSSDNSDDSDGLSLDSDSDCELEDRRPRKRARRTPTSSSSSSSSSTSKNGLPSTANAAQLAFADFYKRSVRSCESVSMGTFDVEQDGFALQYLSETQPIPNHVVNKFKMFGEKWHSSIEYEYLQTGTSTTTALRFTITHVESNTSTSAVETAKEVKMRRTSAKPRTICNRVFLQALGKCRHYLAALSQEDDAEDGGKTRLASLSASGKARKCTESISLFGLRSEYMKDFCLDFLAHKEEEDEE